MPKIYDQKQEPDRDRPTNPLGGPGQEHVRSRGTMLAIAAIVAVIVIIMLYRMARGEELQGAVMQPDAANISAQTSPDLAQFDGQSTLPRISRLAA